MKKADPAAIGAELMGPPRNPKYDIQKGYVRKVTSRGKESTAGRYLELRHTQAAYIVRLTNYKGSRRMAGQEFYGVVGRYIAARKYSAGHHRAGFIPALDTFKGRKAGLGKAPYYRRHRSGNALAAQPDKAITTASVTNKAGGVTKNPTGGNAFQDSKSEVLRQLEKYIMLNLIERGRRNGFKTT